MSNERTNSRRTQSSVLQMRFGCVLLGLMLGFLAGLQAQENQPSKKQEVPDEIFVTPKIDEKEDRSKGTPVPPEGKDRLIEFPKLTEEEQAKLWIEGLDAFKYVVDDAEVQSEDQNPQEYFAYCYTISHAHRLPVDLLARQSMKNVTLANLVKDGIRNMYRNELIHVEGRLVRIDRVIKAPIMVRKTIGIKEYYQGWLFPKDDPNFSPVCVLFTELPTGMEVTVNGKASGNYWVNFDGYYFKLIQYTSQEKSAKEGYVVRRAPLLIGHAPQFATEPSSGLSLSFEGTLFPIILGLGGAVIAVTIGLGIWFRRGDRVIQKHLNASQTVNPFIDESTQVEPGTGWNRLNGEQPAP